MKKLILTATCILMCGTAMYAQKYMTRTAKVSFNATAKGSPEKIEAVNNEVASIIDIKSGDILFQVPVKSFKFERALMQEHFNENYMESDKYPKADFKGTVANMSDANWAKDGTYNTKVTGKLTIHGVSHDITVPGTITVKGTSLKMKAVFPVTLADYKIAIPGVVGDKIAKEATITLESEPVQK